MAALICGSLAYDTIMVFPDQFKNHILPDKVHILNVSFLVPRMRRAWVRLRRFTSIGDSGGVAAFVAALVAESGVALIADLSASSCG